MVVTIIIEYCNAISLIFFTYAKQYKVLEKHICTHPKFFSYDYYFLKEHLILVIVSPIR